MIDLRLNLKPLIKKLEMSTKQTTGGELVGEYRTVFKGKGLDFVGYRVYNPTDDANNIDWKASLRSNDLLVKMLQEERFLRVYILFDISNSMLFSSTGKLKCEYAAELIASLAFVVLHSGDGVGLAMFNDKIVKDIPISLGPKQYYMVIKALSNPSYYGGKFNLTKVLRSILDKVKRETSVIIVSDFIGVTHEFENILRLFSSKCEISGIMIRDPVDNVFPNERKQILLQDPYSNKKLAIDPKVVKEEYDKRAQDQIKSLTKLFTKLNSGFLELETTEYFVTPIIRFFHERRKRWR